MLKRNDLHTIAYAKDCHVPWTLQINRQKDGGRFYLMETDCTLLVAYYNQADGFEVWVEEIKFTDTVRTYDATSDKWTEREVAYVINEKNDGDLFDFLCRVAIDSKELENRVSNMISDGEIAA